MKKNEKTKKAKETCSVKLCMDCRICKKRIAGRQPSVLHDGFKEAMALYDAELQSYFFYFSSITRPAYN